MKLRTKKQRPLTKSQAPATKQDVALIMDSFGKLQQDIFNFKEEITKDMRTFKEEIVHEFHVVTENQLYDFKGFFKDRIEDHGVRIRRLERHTQLAA